jgi:hypothetical protein
MRRPMDPLPHERNNGDRGGLTGRTAAERRAIERRIERLRTAKREEADETVPLSRLCPKCKRPRPLTEWHYDEKRGRFASYCRLCLSERQWRADNSPEGQARRAAYYARPDVKERRRAWLKEKRRRKREAGIKPDKDVRTRLIECRRSAKRRLKLATDPVRRARIEAHILNLTAEIDRIDRNS